MADVSKCGSCGRFVAGGDTCGCGSEKKKAEKKPKKDEKDTKKAQKAEKKAKKKVTAKDEDEPENVGIGSIADDVEAELEARAKRKATAKKGSRYTDFTEDEKKKSVEEDDEEE